MLLIHVDTFHCCFTYFTVIQYFYTNRLIHTFQFTNKCKQIKVMKGIVCILTYW